MPDLPATLGYPFRDQSLLRQALTHRSAGSTHNERLEFLGDATLNFVAAELLFRHFPDATEGDLSRYRARLVSGVALADMARELGLGEALILGPGEMKSGGHRRRSILADTMEAIMGAVYIDGGFEAAAALVARLLEPRVKALPPAEMLKDAKTRLQEWLQGRGHGLPQYQSVAEGAAHARRFAATCDVEELSLQTEGVGSSRRKAEQDAAERMLLELADR